MSDFAVVTGLDSGDFAVEVATSPEEALLLEAAAGLMALAVPSARFAPGVAPEESFSAEVPAGLAAAAGVFVGLGAASGVADPAGELGAELDAGLITEVAGGADFGLCCFDAGVPDEAALFEAAGFAPAADLAGAG